MKYLSQFIAVAAICLTINSCSTSQKIVGNKTGDLAPDISATNTNGEVMKLSSLRGKVVLLEFWDSQNAQSRANHDEIERLYEKYRKTNFQNGNGLDIYSFSIDGNRDKWISAIEQDKTTWPCHVCDFKSWNSKAAIDYQLGSTPKYYLIDGNGIIIKRNILIPELESILTEYIR